MADEKRSFVLYYDYREHLTLLSDSDRGQLFTAIFDYQIDGTIPSLSPVAQMAFSFIKAQLDKDAEKYAETIRHRSEAGKKSAAAKKQNQQALADINNLQQGNTDNDSTNTPQQEPTNTNNNQHDLTNTNKDQQAPTTTNAHQQTSTNSTDNVNVNDNVNVSVGVSDIPPYPPRGERGEDHNDVYSERFNEFWAAYPKKIGKDAALKAFKKRKPSAELLAQMITAIQKQKQSAQWNRDGGQYIPNPATWINQGRWEDELPEQQPNTGYIGGTNRQQPTQGSHNPFINAVINGGGG